MYLISNKWSKLHHNQKLPEFSKFINKSVIWNRIWLHDTYISWKVQLKANLHNIIWIIFEISSDWTSWLHKKCPITIWTLTFIWESLHKMLGWLLLLEVSDHQATLRNAKFKKMYNLLNNCFHLHLHVGDRSYISACVR